jgi:hypothetical protein
MLRAHEATSTNNTLPSSRPLSQPPVTCLKRTIEASEARHTQATTMLARTTSLHSRFGSALIRRVGMEAPGGGSDLVATIHQAP